MSEIKQGRPFLSAKELQERKDRGGYCTSCKQYKPLHEFGKDLSRHPLFVKSRCKSCDSAYQAEYRKKNADAKKKRDHQRYLDDKENIKVAVKRYKDYNKEKVTETAALYFQSHKQQYYAHAHLRRVRKANVLHIPFTADQLDQRMSMFGHKCWICKIGDYETVDHVKPISKGGAHILANLRPCCKTCNSIKRDFWPWKGKVMSGA